MIKFVAQRLRGFKPGQNTFLSWSTLLNRPGGKLVIGADCIISCRFYFDRKNAQISVGDRCFIGKSLIIAAHNVEIEDDVIMSWGITIVDHNSHPIMPELRAGEVAKWAHGVKDWEQVKISKVTVKKKAWIGFNAIILRGVTIGEGAIVGAGSVVTKDVPDGAIVAGNPARVVRRVYDLRMEERT